MESIFLTYKLKLHHLHLWLLRFVLRTNSLPFAVHVHEIAALEQQEEGWENERRKVTWRDKKEMEKNQKKIILFIKKKNTNLKKHE